MLPASPGIIQVEWDLKKKKKDGINQHLFLWWESQRVLTHVMINKWAFSTYVLGTFQTTAFFLGFGMIETACEP